MKENLYRDLVNSRATMVLKGDILLFNIGAIQSWKSDTYEDIVISCDIRQIDEKRVTHSSMLLLNNEMKDIILLK